jgi:sugar phosphate isomerase/epimerase
MINGEGRTRRGFLQDTLMVAAGVGMLRTVARAAEPVGSKARWAITCRDVHLREVGNGDIWAAIRAIGADGMEVDVRADGACPAISSKETTWSVATEDDVKRLRDKLAEEKIRIDVVPRKLAGKEDEFLKFAIDMGKKLVRVAQDADVRYGVENHGTTTNRPDFLRKLFEGVGSPKFGLTLDTANLYWYGHPLSKLYQIFEEFAPNACHTHCKSIGYPEDQREKQRPMGWEYGKYCCPVYEGDVDFKRVAAILRKAGYKGDLCVENESLGRFPKEQRGEILKREVRTLREIAAQA